MHIVDKLSVTFLRILSLIIGLFIGFWWLITLSKWIFEIGTGWGLELGLLVIAPILSLVGGVLYLIILFLLVFKRIINNQLFIKRLGIFWLITILTSIIFTATSEKLYSFPFMGVTNAPISIFESSGLESELGFKPLLPTQPLSDYKPGWKSVSKGTLELTFSNELSGIKVIQATDQGTSSVTKWCNEMKQNNDGTYLTEPITIANESTYIYYPVTSDPTQFIGYCAPLQDRVIYAYNDSRGQTLNLDELKTWLENLE